MELSRAGQDKQSVNRPQNAASLQFKDAPAYRDCFPQSTKVYSEVVHEPTGEVLRVPFRRVALTNGESIDLRDTSGPQDCDVRKGLPKLRASWVARREAEGHPRYTQMYFAKKGILTGELRVRVALF